MLSIAFFLSFIVFFISRLSVWFFFMISISLLKFSFCFCIVFLISLNCISFYHWASWGQLFSILLLGKLQISTSLKLVIGKILCLFGSVMFPWFFLFLEVLFCCICIWRSSHFLQSPLTVFRREIPSASPAKYSEVLSEIFYRYTCSTLLVPPWGWGILNDGILSLDPAKAGWMLTASHLPSPGHSWMLKFLCFLPIL